MLGVAMALDLVTAEPATGWRTTPQGWPEGPGKPEHLLVRQILNSRRGETKNIQDFFLMNFLSTNRETI